MDLGGCEGLVILDRLDYHAVTDSGEIRPLRIAFLFKPRLFVDKHLDGRAFLSFNLEVF
jgi:hypothetical protein